MAGCPRSAGLLSTIVGGVVHLDSVGCPRGVHGVSTRFPRIVHRTSVRYRASWRLKRPTGGRPPVRALKGTASPSHHPWVVRLLRMPLRRFRTRRVDRSTHEIGLPTTHAVSRARLEPGDADLAGSLAGPEGHAGPRSAAVASTHRASGVTRRSGAAPGPPARAGRRGRDSTRLRGRARGIRPVGRPAGPARGRRARP